MKLAKYLILIFLIIIVKSLDNDIQLKFSLEGKKMLCLG
jgi:hypothetical protein